MRALIRLVFVLPLLAACPATTPADAGSDSGVADEPLPCEPDAAIVLDAADGGIITTISPTHPPFQNACSAQQIADYAQCQGGKNTDLCVEFKAGGSAEGCAKCIETPASIDGGTAVWGVIVFNGSTASMNVEGCVNDALGTFECGNALHQLYQCEEYVCSSCTGSDFAACELESANDPKFCQSLAAVVTDSNGPCAAINGDAALPCAVQNCFPNTACTDPKGQQIDWLERIVGYMCGDGDGAACPVPASDHCP